MYICLIMSNVNKLLLLLIIVSVDHILTFYVESKHLCA